jgi:hypothetical protein
MVFGKNISDKIFYFIIITTAIKSLWAVAYIHETEIVRTFTVRIQVFKFIVI